MRENAQRFHVPRLAPGLAPGHVSVCGYGPSLAETWGEITGDVLTTSGAHDFLLERGVVPKYHVETDPREHKVDFVRNSHPDVTYFINSQCHPTMFEILLDAGRRVVMWHGFTDDDAENQLALVEALEPGARVMAGGTNVGMRAIIVAREIGYTHFELHGLDCCYRKRAQWAGKHSGQRHAVVRISVEGREFLTSELMLQSTDDFFNAMRMLGPCSYRIHGDGLLEARMRMFLRDPQKALTWGWWSPVDFVVRAA